MNRLVTIAIAFAIGLFLTYGNPANALAVALTNTNIAATATANSLDSFTDFTTGNAPLISPFDFSPAGHDGTITSQVFQGKGAALGLFVYLYQATLFKDSSSEFLESFSFNIAGTPATVSSMTSFYVGGNGGGATCPVPPSFACPTTTPGTYHPPDAASFNAPTVAFPYFANAIGKGEYGYVVGIFSALPANIVRANVLDGEDTVKDPSVYAPSAVPEPSSVALLGMGLVGLVAWGWRKRQVALVALMIPMVMFALYIHEAMAVSIEYVTPAGSTAGGQPVNAKATFTTSVDRVDIILENLQSDPKSVVQNLSDLKFTLSGSVTDLTPTFNATGNSAQERTVAADKSFTNGAVLTTGAAIGWGLTNIGTSQYYLNDLGGGNAGPAHTLIGPPAGGGTYANANGSIAGNGPHNPFLGQSISWSLDITGINANTTITAAIFSFGTASGVDVTGVPVGSPVPEPSTFLLMGIGLVGLVVWRRKKLHAYALALLFVSGLPLAVVFSPGDAKAASFYSTNFESGVAPAEFSGAGSVVGTQGYIGITGFDSFFLRNATAGNPQPGTTLTLTSLPIHTSINLGFLFATIDSWDGTLNEACSVPSACSPDIFNVRVDGTLLFSKTFKNDPGPADFSPSSPESLAPAANYGFSGFNDGAYNLSSRPEFQNIAHTASTLTVNWFVSGTGWQAGADESWAIDQVDVTLNGTVTPGQVPEPSTWLLLTTGIVGLMVWRPRKVTA